MQVTDLVTGERIRTWAYIIGVQLPALIFYVMITKKKKD